jgi:multidrug efflux pump subunit AcrA (membrane-fusion protein)
MYRLLSELPESGSPPGAVISPGRPSTRRGAGLCLLAALAAPGCGHKEEAHYTSVAKPPTVRVIQPEVRKIVRVVGQPSFVEAYERTSVYPKMTAYIKEWKVDIGDKVRKDEPLAYLFVPELVEDFGTKRATVKLDEEKVELAKKVVEVAGADVKAAEAQVVEAKAILGKYQSEVDRWNTEVKRLKGEVDRGVISPQILLESTNQLRSNTAARDAAQATILKAEAELLSRKAALAKAEVDVSVAKADLSVALSEARRLEAWVGYLTLPAPFDGVIYARNANTFDFVLPATGDPTALSRSPGLSPSGSAAPIYVVDRTDIVRIFIDVPEADANFVHGSDLRLMPQLKDARDMLAEGRDLVIVARVGGALHFRIFDLAGKRVVDTDEKGLTERSDQLAELKSILVGMWDGPRVSPIDKDRVLAALTALFGAGKVPVGTKATVLVKAYRDEPIPGSVTRTSWALNVKSRTLRAEIDLANPGSQLLPGMYAYAKVIIERPGVRALPVSALAYGGDKTFCWSYRDGRSVRTEVRTGVSDGDWIEVTNLQRPEASPGAESWVPVDGTEKIILGDLSILADGAPVEVASGEGEDKVASAMPDGGPRPKPADAGQVK